jgi:glucosamine kinase
MPFYLAIDNGGTKTDYLLADDTRILARVRTGTIKRMRTDAATALANLESALRYLTAQSGVAMSSITRTCIGTAGESVPLVADWLRQQIPAHVAGEFLLLGDVEIALDAAFHGGPGVLALAGTGSNVAARNAAGQLLNVGGWGPALADQGSGHRIGHQALRQVFLAIDEGRPTLLLDQTLAFWHLTNRDELIAYANQLPAPDFSRLTELVLHSANAGDEVAAAVLRQEGHDLGYLVRLILRRVSPDIPTLAFAGSILEKVQPVREALIAAVQQEFPTIKTLLGIVDPIAGALWRARNGPTQP